MSEAAVAVILGSSFSAGLSAALELVSVPTREGAVTLHRLSGSRAAYVLFRHGLPHRWLPHQIPWRAHAFALREVGVQALLVTSSVGVLDAAVPLFEPLLVSDLLMLDNRLPDGSLCTVFREPTPEQGHLLLQEGIVSRALGAQLRSLASDVLAPIAGEVVFGYAPGPRTKTRAENTAWARLGAQVNSMTLGPELVLAAELGIPSAGLVVGHKHSLPSTHVEARGAVAESLTLARAKLERIARAFLERGVGVASGNSLFGFGA